MGTDNVESEFLCIWNMSPPTHRQLNHTCQSFWPFCRQDTSQRCRTQCHTVSSTWYWYWKSNWNCMEYHWREWSNLDRGNIHSYIYINCGACQGIQLLRSSSWGCLLQVISCLCDKQAVVVFWPFVALFLSLSISVRRVCWEGLF